jgi:hypothetical protein
VAILLWKSKSTQKWPPEISKCPDRMEVDGTGDNARCVDNYGLFGTLPSIPATASDTPCSSFTTIQNTMYDTSGFIGNDKAYVPWEGILDGKASRASSLKCAT